MHLIPQVTGLSPPSSPWSWGSFTEKTYEIRHPMHLCYPIFPSAKELYFRRALSQKRPLIKILTPLTMRFRCRTLQQKRPSMKILDLRTQRASALLPCVAVCVAVCWSLLQCVAGSLCNVAVCCYVLQCVVVCCNVLQCAVVCCGVLQCLAGSFLIVATPLTMHRSVLQCVAVCCSMLQQFRAPTHHCIVYLISQFFSHKTAKNHSALYSKWPINIPIVATRYSGGCTTLQIIHKIATNCRALWRQITYKDIYRSLTPHVTHEATPHYRSSTKQPLIVGLFCGKWPTKIRIVTTLSRPLHTRDQAWIVYTYWRVCICTYVYLFVCA